MNITMYSFSKRENSTKQPKEGVDVEVVLKENTSIYTPSFQLMSINAINYNYCKWNDRYYYINDITYIGNSIYLIDCAIDVLGTFKTEIGNTNAFILYGAKNFDVGITDNRLSSNPEVIRTTKYETCFSGSRDMFIVGVLLNGGYRDMGACTQVGLMELTKQIGSSAFGDLFKDPLNGLNKVLSDTSQCLTSAYYSPIVYTAGEYVPVSLVGGFIVDMTLYIASRLHEESHSIEIPWNFALNDFRNRSAFTSLVLYLPCYGAVELNADNYHGKSTITVDITLDSAGGELIYMIDKTTRCTCSILSPVTVSAQQTGNFMGAVGSALGGIGSMMSGNPIGAGAGIFGSVMSAMQVNVGSVGGVGGQATYSAEKRICLTVISHNTNVEPSTLATNYGRPCNKVGKVSDFGGYVQTANASVQANTTQDIISNINSYLNGGVYYE